MLDADCVQPGRVESEAREDRRRDLLGGHLVVDDAAAAVVVAAGEASAVDDDQGDVGVVGRESALVLTPGPGARDPRPCSATVPSPNDTRSHDTTSLPPRTTPSVRAEL